MKVVTVRIHTQYRKPVPDRLLVTEGSRSFHFEVSASSNLYCVNVLARRGLVHFRCCSSVADNSFSLWALDYLQHWFFLRNLTRQLRPPYHSPEPPRLLLAWPGAGRGARLLPGYQESMRGGGRRLFFTVLLTCCFRSSGGLI